MAGQVIGIDLHQQDSGPRNAGGRASNVAEGEVIDAEPVETGDER